MTHDRSMSGTTLAEYVRQAIMDLLLTPDQADGGRPLTEADKKFFAAVNLYLSSEGIEGLDFSHISSVPETFPQDIAEQADTVRLNQGESFFNCGDDARDRIISHKRNAAHALFYRALGDYMEACQAPLKIGNRYHDVNDMMEQDKRWALWERRPDVQGHIRMVQTESIDLSKRLCIVVGGINTVTRNRPEIADTLQQVEQLLGGPGVYQAMDGKAEIALYAISAPTQYRSTIQSKVLAYNAAPEQTRLSHTQPVFETIIRPLVDEAWDGPESGRLERLQTALGQLSFMTKSSGAILVKTLCHHLTDYLHEKGLSQEKIRAVLSCVFVLSLAPSARIDNDASCGNFSTIHAVSPHDHFARSRGYHDRFVPQPGITPQVISVNGGDNELLLWNDWPEAGYMLPQDPASELPHSPVFEHQPRNATRRPRSFELQRGDRTGHNLKLMTHETIGRHPATQAVDVKGDDRGHRYSPKPLQYALRHALLREPGQRLDAQTLRRYLQEPIELFRPRHPHGVRQSFTLREEEKQALRGRAANENKIAVG